MSRVFSADGTQVSENVQLLAPPSQLVLPKATVAFKIDDEKLDSGQTVLKISVSTDLTAIAVALTTSAKGFFVPNYFLARPGKTSVKFMLFSGEAANAALTELKGTTRIEHLAQHVVQYH